MSDQGLQVDNISVSFHGLLALDRISLSLSRGEILGLIGPNGSGKTTCVNAITGQVPLFSGKIYLDGQTVSGLSPREIALSGVMRSFQIVRLFDELPVRENIEIAALAKGVGRADAFVRAGQLLELFHLSDRRADLAGELSYGQKRRVEIARALIANPHFLLLDEPAAGMNEDESADLMALLTELPAQYNLGMLVIDHDMHLITRLCHKIQVISSGQTIACGDVDTVIKDPAVVAAYLGIPESEKADDAAS